jgi:cyclic pyranopterin phosphate synthase
MPAEGVELSPPKHLLTTPEILRLAGLFVNEGVTKIRLTGGEPTLRRDLIDLMAGLDALPGLREICLTSNGLALHRKLPLLAQHGLTALNLSLDTLVPAKFALLTRRPEQGLAAVLRALDTAKGLGIPRIKLNVVVMRGINDDEVVDFVKLARDHAIQVRFIEYMPFGGNRWQEKKMVAYAELRNTIEQSLGAPLEPIPAQPGDTAKNYRLPGSSGGGSVGFITSMTDHFCSSCTRLRLTADGNIKVCLFDNAEVSLRDQLRAGATDAQLLETIGRAVHGKREKHAGLKDLEKMENRPMVLIGG